jgi:hypothetical protein
MTIDKERMQILEMIDSGAISAEDGLRLLQALDGSANSELEKEQDLEIEPAPEEYFDIPQAPVSMPPTPPAAFVLPAAPIPPASPIPPALPSAQDVPSQPASDAWQASSERASETSGPGAESYTNKSTGGDPMSGQPSADTGETVPPRGKTIPSEVERWKRWWMLPLWVGVAITVVGALLMFLAWRASQFSFWFACSWVPFLLGVGVMVLAFASSRMRWLHLRVYQKGNEWPRKISISMPLPLRLIGWIMKIVSSRVPDLREKGVDQMVLALEQTNPKEPFYLEVDDDDDGERVEIYIG